MDSSDSYNTNWRKVASTIYRKPTDSKIYGSVELDVTEIEKYISEKRKEGIKITLTHVITLIIGRAIKTEVPELNTFLKRGKITPRPQIDAMVSVLLQDGEMGSVKIQNIDKLNVAELANEIKDKISKGLIDEKLEPIKCECGSTKFNDYPKDMLNYEVVEKDRYCDKCGKLVGYWSYGYWLP